MEKRTYGVGVGWWVRVVGVPSVGWDGVGEIIPCRRRRVDGWLMDIRGTWLRIGNRSQHRSPISNVFNAEFG